jgi:hypothetical protein
MIGQVLYQINVPKSQENLKALSWAFKARPRYVRLTAPGALPEARHLERSDAS